jgi:hypothetical protein
MMKRLTVAALAAASLLSATAIAGTLAQVETSNEPSRFAAQSDESYVPTLTFGSETGAAFVLP